MANAEPVLALERIGKRFGRLAVLRAVDLAVGAGELVGLMGANGAGKTTLLSIAAGLEAPSSGTRRYWGVPLTELDVSVRARIATVTHTAQVYGRLSARENLALFVSLRATAGLPSQDAGALLERLGLAHAADRAARTFSRGMLQRLALARALLGRPELLLLDEPFTALDRSGRALLAEVLQEERGRGAAILLSSHDFDAIAGITGRVVLLEHGTIAGEVHESRDRDDYRRRVQALAGHVHGEPIHV